MTFKSPFPFEPRDIFTRNYFRLINRTPINRTSITRTPIKRTPIMWNLLITQYNARYNKNYYNTPYITSTDYNLRKGRYVMVFKWYFMSRCWEWKASHLVEFVWNFFENSVEFLNRFPRHQIEDVSLFAGPSLIVGQSTDFLLVDTTDTNCRNLWFS